MIGHEVDDDAQAVAVCAVDQVLKLLHPARHILGQVGVDVVVVFYGVGRAGLALDDGGMVRPDVVASVIRLCGVLNEAGVPHVCGAQVAYFPQGFGREVRHLATPVGADIAAGLAAVVPIAEEAGEYLVDNYFLVFFHDSVSIVIRFC